MGPSKSSMMSPLILFSSTSYFFSQFLIHVFIPRLTGLILRLTLVKYISRLLGSCFVVSPPNKSISNAGDSTIRLISEVFLSIIFKLSLICLIKVHYSKFLVDLVIFVFVVHLSTLLGF